MRVAYYLRQRGRFSSDRIAVRRSSVKRCTMVTTTHNFCLSYIIAALRTNNLASEGQAELKARYDAQRQKTTSHVLATLEVKATHPTT